MTKIKITIDLAGVASDASALLARAMAASPPEPQLQLRAIAVDAGSVAAMASVMRGATVALLGRYYDTMGAGTTQWAVTLSVPDWTRTADSTVLRDSLRRIMALMVAARLLEPTTCSEIAAIYNRQAALEADTLCGLLDTLTSPVVPAPGKVRRPLHPF